MSTPADPPGFELPLLLLHGFRVLIDELHAELARQGHPDMRPMHGFVFQAVGPGGTTAAELGRRLGVSKQAAGKTIDSLQRLGSRSHSRMPGGFIPISSTVPRSGPTPPSQSSRCFWWFWPLRRSRRGQCFY